jgi:hypothetical protein
VESEDEVSIEGNDSSAPRHPSLVVFLDTPSTDCGSSNRADVGQRQTASKPSTLRTEGNLGFSKPSFIPVAPDKRITRAQLRLATNALKGKAPMKTPRWQLQISSSVDSEDGIFQPPSQAADPNSAESSSADMQMAAIGLLSLPETGLQDLEVDLENVISTDFPKAVAPGSPMADVIPPADPEIQSTATVIPLQGLVVLQFDLQYQQLALDFIKRALADLSQEHQQTAIIPRLRQELEQTKG